MEKLAKRVTKGKGRGTKPAEVLESIGRLKERYSRVARYYRMEYDSQTKVFRYSLGGGGKFALARTAWVDNQGLAHAS